MEAIFGIEYVVVMRKLSFRFNFYTRFIIIFAHTSKNIKREKNRVRLMKT